MSESESIEEVRARHKKELKALEGNGRKLVKQANKNKANLAEAESKIAQMDQEIEERHRREVEAAESKKSAAVTDADEPEEGAGAAGAAEDRSAAGGGLSDKLEGMSVEDREKGKRDQKRAKAQRKRDKQREKEMEREERIEKEKAEGGPDPRLVEMNVLGAQVAPLGFRISEIKADGHCLYRAVAEQLSLTDRRPELTEESYPALRDETARALRSSPDDYIPFLDGVGEGSEFDRYCEKVSNSAEWGGQVELQALSKGLGVPIEVFSAMSPPLVLGDEFEGAPLRLSFHEHYYALGAHYNSVVPA